jgi:hypothetical protein
MLSKQDKILMVLPRLVKKVIGKWCYIKEGKEKKYTHLRWVDMCKWQRMIPRHKGSPRYRIAHGWKIEYESFNLEALNFLMHFREPGSSLYFYFYTYSYFSFFFVFSSFFLSFIHSFILSFSHSSFFPLIFLSHKIFYLLPFWTLKITLYLPPPPCLDVARPRAKRR